MLAPAGAVALVQRRQDGEGAVQAAGVVRIYDRARTARPGLGLADQQIVPRYRFRPRPEQRTLAPGAGGTETRERHVYDVGIDGTDALVVDAVAAHDLGREVVRHHVAVGRNAEKRLRPARSREVDGQLALVAGSVRLDAEHAHAPLVRLHADHFGAQVGQVTGREG